MSTFRDLKELVNSLSEKELDTKLDSVILTCGGCPDDLQFCTGIEIERCKCDYWESLNGEMIYEEDEAKDEFEDDYDYDNNKPTWEDYKKNKPEKLMHKKGELIIKVHQEV